MKQIFTWKMVGNDHFHPFKKAGWLSGTRWSLETWDESHPYFSRENRRKLVSEGLGLGFP